MLNTWVKHAQLSNRNADPCHLRNNSHYILHVPLLLLPSGRPHFRFLPWSSHLINNVWLSLLWCSRGWWLMCFWTFRSFQNSLQIALDSPKSFIISHHHRHSQFQTTPHAICLCHVSLPIIIIQQSICLVHLIIRPIWAANMNWFKTGGGCGSTNPTSRLIFTPIHQWEFPPLKRKIH